MTEPIFYVNGRFVPESKASIGVYDLGLLRAYGVFDYTITYHRKPFRLKDHLERLENSARIIDLGFPWTTEQLTQLVHETLVRNPRGEMSIRIIVTGGQAPDSFTPAGRPSLVIMVKPVKVYPRSFYSEGVKVITFPGKREFPQAKTLNYVHAITALKRARREGAEEALYAHNGVVSECMVCSFFAVKDRRIITAGKDVLDGITRRTVLELVKGKIPVDFRFVTISEIPSLDEALLTSSNHEVMPIVNIDETRVGDGKPGPVTREVMRLFDEYTGKNES
jgi:branched-chain amino acid aminotransferase